MPRGVKGSGKNAKKAAPVETVEVLEKAEAPVVEKSRKAYPSLEERLVMVDQKIEQLQNLNAEREALIEKTENTLNERRATLEKSTAQLNKVLIKKEKLLALKNKPARTSAVRSEKAAEKKQMEELLAALKAKGKSVEDLFAALEQ